MAPFFIEENKLEDVLEVLALIPEFDNIPDAASIQSRLGHLPHLILSARNESGPIGFKVGYERDGKFYSWLGAIAPAYRHKGVATALANRQEEWARNQGYTAIWMKTRNRFPQMLLMAIGRGFRIVGFMAKEEVGQHRIVLEKSI